MKHLAAYCLLVLGGNAKPSEEDVAKLLKDVGVKSDPEALATCVKKLSEASIPAHIAKGSAKMGAVGGGGGAAAAVADAPAEETKKAEKEPEKEASDDDA